MCIYMDTRKISMIITWFKQNDNILRKVGSTLAQYFTNRINQPREKVFHLARLTHSLTRSTPSASSVGNIHSCRKDCTLINAVCYMPPLSIPVGGTEASINCAGIGPHLPTLRQLATNSPVQSIERFMLFHKDCRPR